MSRVKLCVAGDSPKSGQGTKAGQLSPVWEDRSRESVRGISWEQRVANTYVSFRPHGKPSWLTLLNGSGTKAKEMVLCYFSSDVALITDQSNHSMNEPIYWWHEQAYQSPVTSTARVTQGMSGKSATV